MKFFFAILVLVLAVVVYHQTNGLCNTCSLKTHIACVATDKFRFCSQGLPQGNPIECPSGSFCTSETIICDPAAPTKSCAKCGVCNGNFACTGYNKFSFCEDDVALNVSYTCPNEQVCDIGSLSICVNPKTNGVGGTCPWEDLSDATTVPTTPDALTNPNEFCSSKNKRGRYDVSSDPTCQTFISCILSGTSWVGGLYSCAPGTYFNGTTAACGLEKPERCA